MFWWYPCTVCRHHFGCLKNMWLVDTGMTNHSPVLFLFPRLYSPIFFSSRIQLQYSNCLAWSTSCLQDFFVNFRLNLTIKILNLFFTCISGWNINLDNFKLGSLIGIFDLTVLYSSFIFIDYENNTFPSLFSMLRIIFWLKMSSSIWF